MSPRLFTNINVALLLFKCSFERVEFGIPRSVHAHEYRLIAALPTINRKIEFFLPAPLPRRGNGYSDFQLIGAFSNYAVDLPPLRFIAVAFDRTSFGGCRRSADCVRNNGLE